MSRAGQVAGRFASRLRALPDAWARSETEGVARAIQGSVDSPETVVALLAGVLRPAEASNIAVPLRAGGSKIKNKACPREAPLTFKKPGPTGCRGSSPFSQAEQDLQEVGNC
jgi:hypothetical protein